MSGGGISSWLAEAWSWIGREENQKTLMWIGSAIVAMAGVLWAAFQKISRKAQTTASSPTATPGTSPPLAPPSPASSVLPSSLTEIVLKIISPTVVDQRPIHEALKRFDSEWPAVTVQWPHSADELINILQRALDQFDKGVGLLTGAETFARNVPTIIARIPEDRERAQALIPAMVRRLRNLEEHHRVVAISSFLLYSNCMIHADANYYAKDLGLEVPPVWAVLQSFDRLGVIFGEVKEEIMRVRIVKVDEIRIPGGFYISLPKRYEKGRYSAKKNDIEGFCRWIVPQLEYVANVELPSTYTGNWMFDKISGE